MSKIILSKSKISRKYGVNLWGKPNDAFVKKSYIPGQHGGKVIRQMKTYRKQLVEKNKMRFYHAVSEKKFSNLVNQAIASMSDSVSVLVESLNSMLASTIFASGLAPSIFFAKQIVSHGHILVNEKRVNIATYRLSVGDVITIHASMFNSKIMKEFVESSTTRAPDYLKVEKSKGEIAFVAKPTPANVLYASEMNPSTVVEYYSK